MEKINCKVIDPYFCGIDWEQTAGEMPEETRDIKTLSQGIKSLGYVISNTQVKKLKEWSSQSHNHTEWSLYTITGKHKCLTLNRYPDKKRMVFKKKSQ